METGLSCRCVCYTHVPITIMLKVITAKCSERAPPFLGCTVTKIRYVYILSNIEQLRLHYDNHRSKFAF